LCDALRPYEFTHTGVLVRRRFELLAGYVQKVSERLGALFCRDPNPQQTLLIGARAPVRRIVLL